MQHKKVLIVSLTATALALAILALVLGKGSSVQSEAFGQRSTFRRDTPLHETDGEVTATLPLLRRVDENYLRGSQPLRGGIGMLGRLGVKTIVDLRSIYDYNEDVKSAAESSGLSYHWLPMSIWDPPTDKEANDFISLVTNAAMGPFFVFCADGLNRTGEMTAIYRVVSSGWSVEKALAEADELGFNPYCYTLRNYVWDYARKFRPSAVPPGARRLNPVDRTEIGAKPSRNSSGRKSPMFVDNQ